MVVALALNLICSLSALSAHFFTHIRRQRRCWSDPMAAQGQALVHNGLHCRACDVVAALERTDASSSIFLEGGGKSADTASLTHTALSYSHL